MEGSSGIRRPYIPATPLHERRDDVRRERLALAQHHRFERLQFTLVLARRPRDVDRLRRDRRQASSEIFAQVPELGFEPRRTSRCP